MDENRRDVLRKVAGATIGMASLGTATASVADDDGNEWTFSEAEGKERGEAIGQFNSDSELSTSRKRRASCVSGR